MPNGPERSPFPLPPIFPDRPRRPGPSFPFPFPSPFPDDPGPRLPRPRPRPLPPLAALPVPIGPARPPFGFPPAEVRSLPLPGANEPFGGRVIRIGRILRGIGLGSILIIGAEILVDVIRRKQLRELGQILEEQDVAIAQAQIEKIKAAEQRKIDILERGTPVGRLPLPQVGAPTIPDVVRDARPEIVPEILPPALPFPEIQLPQAEPISFPDPAPPQTFPFPSTLPGQTPGTFPGAFPLPSPTPLPTPFPTPTTRPAPLPVAFPIAPPIGDPFRPSIGDPLPTPLTPVGPGAVPLGFADVPDPSAAPQPQTRRCEVVKRRRRRKGKCREGFFVERPGETQFITWRDRECDTVADIF